MRTREAGRPERSARSPTSIVGSNSSSAPTRSASAAPSASASRDSVAPSPEKPRAGRGETTRV
ncbi:hypothetical protein ACSNOI_41495 [Actinomadura kijaniata]|uniref:hypothetical protein n=1 Tax=Actinomadura kijaniata TaxID=46161 RepID=UPI003F1D7B17